MAQLIEMPKLSDTMTVGTVVKWHKNKGDSVSNGDILAEIETDTATTELEYYEDGIVLEIFVKAGLEVPIGSPLVVVGEAGEDISSLSEWCRLRLKSVPKKSVPAFNFDEKVRGCQEAMFPILLFGVIMVASFAKCTGDL